ncbi:hypothetical protein [Micromonospora sp. NPDC003816]|uniref:hypothetical protein n=1 Tax=Micromonospora sp. NPDC003816 TaxID=3364224 RepID=UPI00367D1A96
MKVKSRSSISPTSLAQVGVEGRLLIAETRDACGEPIAIRLHLPQELRTHHTRISVKVSSDVGQDISDQPYGQPRLQQ